jgi:hypothetical protein
MYFLTNLDIQLACLNKWQAGIKDESVLVDTEFGISND